MALANNSCIISSQYGTCVIEDSVFDGAILKERVGWFDILKVAVLKQRILKLDGLNLNICKPKWK